MLHVGLESKSGFHNLVGKMVSSSQCLCDILVDNAGIQKLQLNSTNLGDEGAKAIAEMLKKNSSLRVLELNNNVIDYSGFTSIAGALLENNTIQILSLKAREKQIFEEDEPPILLSTLEHVKLCTQGAEKIAEALKQNRTVTNIDLGGNNIHAKGASDIAQVLKDNSVITSLEIGYNPIGPDGAKALSEVLKFHGNIKTLSLGWCQDRLAKFASSEIFFGL